MMEPESADPLLKRIDRKLFLQVHGRCHALFDWEFLGPRCAEWTLDSFGQLRLSQSRKRKVGMTMHRENPMVWKARFVQLGTNRWRTRLPLSIPIETVSRLGKPDAIDLAWVLIEPGGSEEVIRWNSQQGIQVEHIGPTSSGQWRIDLLDTTKREGLPRYVTIIGIPLYTWFNPNDGVSENSEKELVPDMPQASTSDSDTDSPTK
jgi:hypothetical protein